MTDTPGGPDWEQGSDGRWYKPGVLSGAGWRRATDGRWYGPGQPGQIPPARPRKTIKDRWDATPTWGKALSIGGAALLVVLFVAAAIAGPEEEPEAAAPTTTASDQPETTTTDQPAAATTGQPAPTTTTAPPAPTTTRPASERTRDTLVDVVNDALGGSNRDADRVHEITVNDDGSITISWAINENITEGLTKDTGRLETVDILRAVHDSDVDDYTILVLHGTYSLVDQLGNTSEDEVFSAIYEHETVDAINYDNFDFKQAWDPGVAFSPFIHPAFIY